VNRTINKKRSAQAKKKLIMKYDRRRPLERPSYKLIENTVLIINKCNLKIGVES
jgi:hypothetical protein